MTKETIYLRNGLSVPHSTTIKRIKKTLSSDPSVVYLLKTNHICYASFLVAPKKAMLNPLNQINELNTFMWKYLDRLSLGDNGIRQFSYSSIGEMFKFGYVTLYDKKQQAQGKIAPITPECIQILFLPSLKVAQYINHLDWYLCHLELEQIKTDFPELLSKKTFLVTKTKSIFLKLITAIRQKSVPL